MDTIANCLIGPVALALLALPSLRRAANARWILLLVFVSIADSVATLLPHFVHALRIPHAQMNWSGKLIDIAVMLVVVLVLSLSGALSRRDVGFTLAQAPGTGRAILFVALPFLLAVAALAVGVVGNAKPPSTQIVLYEATLPGLAEEIVWRGLLLAVFDKIFPARMRILGAELGFGALATALVFGLVHTVQFDAKLALQTDWAVGAFAAVTGLVLAYLRARTQSLVVPAIVHNATNIILECVPRLL